jgi:hypothetical protein
MMIIFRIILIIINRFKMFIKEALSRNTVVPATLAVTSLDPIQIRRSDILQSYWFLVRPLGPNFLRYATNTQCRNSPFS